MGKGLRTERLINVFRWARNAGLERRAYFILGMPNESAEDVRKTEELIRQLEPEVVGVTILCPYPGSDLYNPDCHQTINWAETDEYGNDFWRTKYLSNAELHQWQEKLIHIFSDRAAWHHHQTQ